MRRSEPKLNADSFNEVCFIMLTIPFSGPKAPLSGDPCFVMAFPRRSEGRGERPGSSDPFPPGPSSPTLRQSRKVIEMENV